MKNTIAKQGTNDLRHKMYKYTSTLKLTVSIRLNDECGNGHADFSITCSAREKFNDRWRETFSGCCHDEILKYFPNLQRFVDLHLSDSNGAPMYALENGFYHLWDKNKNESERIKTTCEYLRINKSICQELLRINDKAHFQYILEKHKIPDQWQKEANKAIEYLESLTGKKWNKRYTWQKSNYEEKIYE